MYIRLSLYKRQFLRNLNVDMQRLKIPKKNIIFAEIYNRK